jgi:hypothetical protein
MSLYYAVPGFALSFVAGCAFMIWISWPALKAFAAGAGRNGRPRRMPLPLPPQQHAERERAERALD